MPDGATAYQLRVVVAAEPAPDCLLIALEVFSDLLGPTRPGQSVGPSMTLPRL